MDWSDPGRETVENIRLFFGKYLLPVWPELAKVWPEVILVGLTDGVPALYAIEDEE